MRLRVRSLLGQLWAPALVLSLAASSAQGALIALQPDDGKDAQLMDEVNANKNLDGRVLISNTAGSDPQRNLRSIGLIEFDLSRLPAGATITSATLSLYQESNPNLGQRYDIFRVTSPWDERTVTFNTAPDFDPAAVSSLIIGDNASGEFRHWDITTLVAAWYSGASPNFGLWIEEVPIAGDGTAFFSSSDSRSGTEPSLRIRFDAPVPEPAVTLLLGTGFLALARIAGTVAATSPARSEC